MYCPDCRYENIAGADYCEKCGQPLTGQNASLSELERSIISHPISVLAIHAPVAVPSTTTVREALRTMLDRKIGCILVVDGGGLRGIFTERDVLNRVTGDRKALDQPITGYMTPSPQTVKHTDSIAYALHEMSVHGYRHLPVADDTGRAISVISARDVLRLLAVRYADIRRGA
jgi:CBS domain-containing protein